MLVSGKPAGYCPGIALLTLPSHTDSLAWLVLTIQLITKHGYDVTKEGQVIKI